MLCLAIEGSANKIGVGIIQDDGRILANERLTYNAPTGEGFMPKKVAEHHRNVAITLIKKALSTANMNIRDIELFAYTKGPGMGGPLSVGAIIIRTLSLLFNKPIIGVNHCVAHIEMGRLCTSANNPTIMYASGANTQIIVYSSKRYKIFGETLDIAVGNVIDRVVRLLNIPNEPAPGYQLEQRAKNGINLYDLPYAVKGMDICLSGLLTNIEGQIAKHYTPIFRKTLNAKHKCLKFNSTCNDCVTLKECDQLVNDFCFSLQETIEITERAMAHTHSDSVMLVGGVACNLRLQEMMQIMCTERGAILCSMDERYCIDNGAMIGWTALLEYKHSGAHKFDTTTYTQRYRTDNVNICWRE